ncbi:uncharacterized protein VTP21DRAFT_8738 [Calcarisporiella thermophila]|uniref:uncharacterized protein n=1 Tax=Calcarisporiella thermophila TaxID=911321 RepID=UPI003742E879
MSAQSQKEAVLENLSQTLVIVVLGASGDLARKKTFPALFSLHKNGFLPKRTKIIGYARSQMDLGEYHKRVASHFKNATGQEIDQFLSQTFYVSGKYDDDGSFEVLRKEIEKAEKEIGAKEPNRIAYLALPPSVFTIVGKQLKKHIHPGQGQGVFRVVVEKPFGHDLESFRELQNDLGELFTEDEIYRIDHYLGKEMVKNLLTLRFANIVLGAIWNRHYIDNVQITFREPFGTEGRGGYFDEFGIIRDVMQNHLLQVLSIVAMERPVSLEPEDIRDEKVKVLRCIPPIKPEDSLIGQYTKSEDGSKPGYKDDDTVPKDSNCPTFAITVLWINNDRWQGVPFILKAGKALNEQKVEVRVQFRDVAGQTFEDVSRNELVVRVQPNEAVYLKMINKLPGFSMNTTMTELDLTYRQRYTDLYIPEAYEALILDVLKGDHSNFVRDDELDAAWKAFTPILHHIDEAKMTPLPYAYGTRGPAEADEFVAKYGYKRTDEYSWPSQSARG